MKKINLKIVLIAFFASVNLLAFGQDYTSNLVAHYEFENTSGDVVDAAGSHTGTTSGALTRGVTGKIGNCFDFNQGGYVDINYNSDLALNNYTVAAWVKITDTPSGYGSGILGTRFNSDQTFDCKVNISRIHGDIGNGSSWLTTGADYYITLSQNIWYHIVYVVNSSGWSIYLDGSQVNSGSYSGTPLFRAC